MRILLIGNFDEMHLGRHYADAAAELKLPCFSLDTKLAWSNSSTLNKLSWHLFQRTPPNLPSFTKRTSQILQDEKIEVLINLGLNLLAPETLSLTARLGVKTYIFLSDDPWNPAHRNGPFLETLGQYNHVYSPRLSTLLEISRMVKAPVSYLPFGYNPKVHHPASDLSAKDIESYSCDISFFGGADADRVSIVSKLINQGLKIRLYGGYWDRYPITKPFAGGFLDSNNLRKLVGLSKISLNLIRRANRDGHVMRSFEIPAMGGCMLMENTEEHAQIFGVDTQTVFNGGQDILEKIRTLLGDSNLRQLWAKQQRETVLSANHGYPDRLKRILSLTNSSI